MSEKLKLRLIYNVSSSIRTNIRAFVLGLSLQRQMTMETRKFNKNKEKKSIQNNLNRSKKDKDERARNMSENVDKIMRTEITSNFSKL